MESQKSNELLQVEVREELTREPSVDANAIGITTDHGLVYLSGHMLGVAQRRSADEATLRVDGVRAVIDGLKIRSGRRDAHDADLACAASDSLNRLIGLPDGRVKVVVRNGKVLLKGVVSRQDQKDVIAATVQGAIGCKEALNNAITVEPGEILTLTPTLAHTLPLLVNKPSTMAVEGEPQV